MNVAKLWSSLAAIWLRLTAIFHVEPPPFLARGVARGLIIFGIVAFALTGISGYSYSPSPLKSAIVFHPLLLFLWGALLLMTLQLWVARHPVDASRADQNSATGVSVKASNPQLWTSIIISAFGIALVSVLVVRPDWVTSVLASIAKHLNTDTGKAVANVFNFYFVVVFLVNLFWRHFGVQAWTKLRAGVGRLWSSWRSERTSVAKPSTPQSSAASSESKPGTSPIPATGSGSASDPWTRTRELSVDLVVFGILMLFLSQLMRLSVLNVIFAQTRQGGVSAESVLNAPITQCTVSLFSSACTSGVSPDRLPTLTFIDLLLAAVFGGLGLLVFGTEWATRRVETKAESDGTAHVEAPGQPYTAPAASDGEGTDAPATTRRKGKHYVEQAHQAARIEDDAEAEAVREVPRAFLRYLFAVLRSIRIFWPAFLAGAIASVALAAHYSQLYLHVLSCEHQLRIDTSAPFCGVYHAAWVDSSRLDYHHLLFAILLAVCAALCVLAAVALLVFKWGPNLDQGVQDFRNWLNMLSYWLRILGHFAARVVWPLMPICLGLLLFNYAYKRVAETMLGHGSVPLPFFPPGILFWFSLVTYLALRRIPRLIRWVRNRRAARTPANVGAP